MKIAVIGMGNVGSIISLRWAEFGHEVLLGVRDPAAEKAQAVVATSGGRAKALTVAEAAAGAGVIVLATPFSATEEVINGAGDLAGKIVIDCTNPLAPDLSALTIGLSDSAGEMVTRWASGAEVAKALSETGAGNMADPTYPDGAVSMFICGADRAKETARGLCEQLGFEVVD